MGKLLLDADISDSLTRVLLQGRTGQEWKGQGRAGQMSRTAAAAVAAGSLKSQC